MMKITIDDDLVAEFEYMIELYQQHGSPAQISSVEALVEYVLWSVADGSRRPGSWERSMLEMLGLVAECDEHQQYRRWFGKPTDNAG